MSNKQGSNREANIRAYYSEVNKFGQNGEYDKAIKSLNKSKLMSESIDIIESQVHCISNGLKIN